MGYITVSNSFVNSTTASASEVNTNFSDIIAGTSDGTKDFSIAALTCAGTLTANGNVSLGNASSDDLTITASLASSIPIKTNTTYDIGSVTLGLRALYFGGATTKTTKVVGTAVASDRIVTIPDPGTNADFVMTAGTQTIAGNKTLSGSTDHTGTCTLSSSRILSATVAITAATHSGFDVSGKNILTIGNLTATIQGFANGVTGQIIHIVCTSSGTSLTLNAFDAGGTQQIVTPSGSNLTLASYGGATLWFNGTNWYVISYAT